MCARSRIHDGAEAATRHAGYATDRATDDRTAGRIDAALDQPTIRRSRTLNAADCGPLLRTADGNAE